MQRFQIASIYLSGVAVILSLAAWGVSMRGAAPRAAASMNLPSAPNENQPTVTARTAPSQTPDTAVADNHGIAKVSIDNFSFVPENLTIAPGTTVTWTNTDDVPHTATSTARPAAFDSKTLDTDDKYSIQFKTPGIYEYYCKIHPHMLGRIIVK